jgi:hypothetical protein
MSGAGRLTEGGNHAGRNNIGENSSEIVHRSPDDNRLVPQSPRRCLRHNRITSGSHRDHIAQRRNDEQDRNSKLRARSVGPTETSYRDEAEEHERQATHIDGRSADMREKKPADDTADNVACRKGDVDVKRLDLRKPCRFEKDNRVAEEGVAAEDLGGPDDAVLSQGEYESARCPK